MIRYCWCGRPVGAHGPAERCEKPRVRIPLTAEERKALDKSLEASVEIINSGQLMSGEQYGP